MSGPDDYALARAEEREDVLALLDRRRVACQRIAKANAGEAERAGVMERQLSVLIDEIRGGMHEGEAAAGAALTAPTEEA